MAEHIALPEYIFKNTDRLPYNTDVRDNVYYPLHAVRPQMVKCKRHRRQRFSAACRNGEPEYPFVRCGGASARGEDFGAVIIQLPAFSGKAFHITLKPTGQDFERLTPVAHSVITGHECFGIKKIGVHER